MAYSKTQIIEALQKVTATETSKNLVEAGHVKNVQVFGDEVVVDVISISPALHVKKKLEVDILKTVHDEVDTKLKIKVNIEVPEAAQQKANMIRFWDSFAKRALPISVRARRSDEMKTPLCISPCLICPKVWVTRILEVQSPQFKTDDRGYKRFNSFW